MTYPDWIEALKWGDDDLLPAIAQEATSGELLMVAWMNREALQLTVAQQRAIYFSRSRQRLWPKGEESGNVQRLVSIHTDCDSDVILLRVEQIGGIACHTGRRSCFFRQLEAGVWRETAPVLVDPATLYGGRS